MSIYFQESHESIKYHMNSHSSIFKNLQIVAEGIILGGMEVVALGLVVATIHSHVEVEHGPSCGVMVMMMMKSCIGGSDLRRKIRLRDHPCRLIHRIVALQILIMSVGRERQTRRIPSPKGAAAAAAHQACKRRRILLKISRLHLQTLLIIFPLLFTIILRHPRLMVMMMMIVVILDRLPCCTGVVGGEVVVGVEHHDALRDLQRRQLVDLVFGGVQQPVHHLAGLVEAEPLLEVVELDGGGDGEADAPVPQTSYRAHFAVPVFAPQGPRHSDYPRIFQPGP